MEYKFSNRALSAKPSRIREISARGAIDPEFISFAIGNPAYETFPVEEIRRCMAPDEKHKLEKELQDLTDKRCKDIDELTAKKEQELMAV